MTKLNLSELTHYSSNGLHQYLVSLKAKHFEIIIPRKAIMHRCDHDEIVMEFLSAAYAGQRLSLICKHFSYYIPCPEEKAPFLFQVTVNDIKKFAYLLFVITQAFTEMGSQEALPAFHIDVANFLNNANKNNKEVNTWGLIFVANQFL